MPDGLLNTIKRYFPQVRVITTRTATIYYRFCQSVESCHRRWKYIYLKCCYYQIFMSSNFCNIKVYQRTFSKQEKKKVFRFSKAVLFPKLFAFLIYANQPNRLKSRYQVGYCLNIGLNLLDTFALKKAENKYKNFRRSGT